MDFKALASFPPRMIWLIRAGKSGCLIAGLDVHCRARFSHRVVTDGCTRVLGGQLRVDETIF